MTPPPSPSSTTSLTSMESSKSGTSLATAPIRTTGSDADSSQAPSATTLCPCQSSQERRLLCSSCVKRAWKDAHERRQRALEHLEAARTAHARHVAASQNAQDGVDTAIRLTQAQDRFQHLQRRLAVLRAQCTQTAVQLTADAVANQERQQEQQQRQRQRRQQGHRQVTPPACAAACAALEETTDALSQNPLRQHLAELRTALQDEAMARTVEERRRHVAALRYSWALTVFSLHRILVVDENEEEDKSQRTATSPSSRSSRTRISGIGKIGGLPLPHAGPDLYPVLPEAELTSALRLVASVTATVAQCLGICLPHAISTHHTLSSIGTGVNRQQQDLAELYEEDEEGWWEAAESSRSSPATTTTTAAKKVETSASTNPLTSQLMGNWLGTLEQGAKKVLASAAAIAISGHDNNKSSRQQADVSAACSSSQGLHDSSRATTRDPTSRATTTTRRLVPSTAVVPLSMDPARVSERVRYAVSAVLSEDSGRPSLSSRRSPRNNSSSRYALLAQDNSSGGGGGNDDEENFAIALQFLQNDIIALCIRAGVPVARLAPAQAVLLNLQALQEHCLDQITSVHGEDDDNTGRDKNT